MWRNAKRGIYRLACTAGLPAVSRRRNQHRLLILAYHGLRANAPPVGTSWSLLHVDEFDRQLGYLTARYRIMGIDAAMGELYSGGLREPTACITFDDGYRSNLTLGMNVLERYGAPATIYLATGMIGTDRLIWTIELDLAFQQTPGPTMDLSALGMGVVPLGDVTNRAALARQVIHFLKPLNPADREHKMAHLRAELNDVVPAHGGAYSFMTWDEVRQMEASGLVSFGAHTVNHEIVATLSDTALSEEIVNSIDAVQAQVRETSATFAYPNGTRADFDERAVAVLRTCGCVGAVSTIEGLNDRGVSAFELRRFNIGSEMRMDEFRLLTSGALPRRARVQD